MSRRGYLVGATGWFPYSIQLGSESFEDGFLTLHEDLEREDRSGEDEQARRDKTAADHLALVWCHVYIAEV